jgi:hypothetical protein
MSEVTKEASEKVDDAARAASGAVQAQVQARKVEFTKLLTLLKRHPLGLVAAIGVGAALVEVELAVGLLTGLGATALLATKSGPEARQEVVAKGKAALERARAVLASRSKPAEAGSPAPAAPAPEVPTPTPATPAEKPPAATA